VYRSSLLDKYVGKEDKKKRVLMMVEGDETRGRGMIEI